MAIHSLKAMGQLPNDLYKDVRENLQDLKIRFNRHLDDDSDLRLDILIDRFSASGPIVPKNFFEMNYSSSAAIVGTVVTYLIVLIEFKSSYQINVNSASQN